MLLASDELMRKQPGRKAIILLTDGVDNGSKVDLFRAIESAQRADTLVYSILFSDRGAYDGVYASMNGKKALQRISRETGGAFFEVSDSEPISAIYCQLEEELRNQYSIGYTSDRTDAAAGYRKIHLATKRSGLRGAKRATAITPANLQATKPRQYPSDWPKCTSLVILGQTVFAKLFACSHLPLATEMQYNRT